jgi:hypothetical protein
MLITGYFDTQDEETQCVGHHNAQTNTNNVNKTWALLQTTGGKYEPENLGTIQSIL